jgi:hypothetical protein
MKLEITKERVLETVEKYPQSKGALKTLFPEAFIEKIRINIQKGDVLVSKKDNKSYLISIDGEKYVRIVGLHSAYAWENKTRPIDQFHITSKDISVIFPQRKFNDYVLKRGAKFYNIISGQEILGIDELGKYKELYFVSLKLF